jgi:hypothetical protein
VVPPAFITLLPSPSGRGVGGEGNLGLHDNGRSPILLWHKPLREQRRRRGFHHLADRLTLPDDSLNSCVITCLRAGLSSCEIIPPKIGMSRKTICRCEEGSCSSRRSNLMLLGDCSPALACGASVGKKTRAPRSNMFII